MDLALVGVIGSVLAGIGSIYAVRASRAKVEAETESVYITNAENLVRLMQNRLDTMQKELDGLQGAIKTALAAENETKLEVIRLRARVSVLEAYIRQHGLALPAIE